MMERAEILAAMADLKLFGMRAAYDELMATAIRRQHEPQKVVGDLLAAEINEKKARSVKYQITVAKLPFAREIEEFTFDSTPINETLVRDLARGEFLNQQRNVVLVGGTGTGKTHISVGIARAVIRNGARGRFFNVVDLVNKLEAEARAGRAGRLAEHLMRLDFVVLDELGYLPFAQSGGQLLFHLISARPTRIRWVGAPTTRKSLASGRTAKPFGTAFLPAGPGFALPRPRLAPMELSRM